MKHYIPILATTVAFAAGCNQTPSAATTGTAETTSAVETGSGTTVSLSKEDREFMMDAAESNMFEVALGQQLEKKASSPDVRAFAAMMVRDHTKANDELKQLAAKKGFSLPTQLDQDERADIDEITRLSGTELDKKYIAEMVDEHEEDVEDFRNAVKEVKDPELRAWTEKTLRTLESHLAAAKELQGRIGG